ncbi:MAG: AMP-binding protein [Dehalococcoidia bacterium]|nr:AMP-binding protein [Dehalococcoidia bacterium]
MENLAELVRTAAESYRDRVALRLEAAEPAEWTYRRLGEAVEAVASALRGPYAIERGERVLVWGSASSPQLVAAYLGCLRAGIVLVPIDPRSAPDFVARVAARTEARALISDVPEASSITVAARIPLAELPDGSAPSSLPPLEDWPAPDDLAEVVFTSGTTGDPKGVMLTHANILASVTAIQAILPAGDYRLLSLLPISHMLEQTPGLFVMLAYGAEIIYVPSRLPATIIGAMSARQPTMLLVVPLLLELLMHGIEREVKAQGKERLWTVLNRVATVLPIAARRLLFRSVLAKFGGRLEFMFCGGARLEPALAQAWERLGVKVVEGYGATECSPLLAANTLDRRLHGSVGRVALGVELRISEEGELQARGPNVTSGYWRHPEATAAAFSADGWYRTGDLAEIDNEGNVRLHGRLRDMIVLSSGLNVYPEDLEAALRAQPEVADCVALLVPDEERRDRIMAVVLPSRDGAAPDDADLAGALQRANRQLAPHQRMTGHLTWPDADFPRTNSMKVQRRLILERLGELQHNATRS